MTLLLSEYRVAEDTMKCDASMYFRDHIFRELNDELKSRFIPVQYKCKCANIQKGEKFKYYEFVDEEGEFIQMSCREYIDNFMVKNKFYPEIIMSCIS